MVHHAVVERVVVGLDRAQPVAQHQVAVHQVVVDRVVETTAVHVGHSLHIGNAEVAHRRVRALALVQVLREAEVVVGSGVRVGVDWSCPEVEMSVLANQEVLVQLFWLFEGCLFGSRLRQERAKVVIVVRVDIVSIDVAQIVGKSLIELTSIEDRIVFINIPESRSLIECRVGVLLRNCIRNLIIEEDRRFKLGFKEFFLLQDGLISLLLLLVIGCTFVVADDGGLIPLAGPDWFIHFFLWLL